MNVVGKSHSLKGTPKQEHVHESNPFAYVVFLIDLQYSSTIGNHQTIQYESI